MHLKITFAAAALAVFSACAPTDFASNTETKERTLTVREIDPATRTFAVTGDGQRFNVRVSDAVVNFDQIEVGDRVNVVFTESVAVSMALPEDTGETVAVTGVAAAPVGARPGIASGQLISAVVTFVAYDPRSHSVTVRNQAGELLIAEVPRELRRFAAARQPGDQIEVALTETFAVSVTPAP
jgi:hypothetical protein